MGNSCAEQELSLIKATTHRAQVSLDGAHLFVHGLARQPAGTWTGDCDVSHMSDRLPRPQTGSFSRTGLDQKRLRRVAQRVRRIKGSDLRKNVEAATTIEPEAGMIFAPSRLGATLWLRVHGAARVPGGLIVDPNLPLDDVDVGLDLSLEGVVLANALE